MDNYNRGKLGIIACESGRPFAEKVVSELENIIKKEEKPTFLDRLKFWKKRDITKVKFIDTKETWFANTEPKEEIEESIRNRDIYIFQDVENKTGGRTVNDNFRVLKTGIQAARMSDAHYITAVIPVFPYARQDKQKTREAITAADAAREIEDTGATRVITLDIHNNAIAGFFRKAVLENLRASKNISDYIIENVNLENLVVVAPDTGAVPRNEYYANILKTELNMIYKKRDYTTGSKINKMILLGNVEGKDVLLVDDMVDTGGTLEENVLLLKDNGAKKIYFACSLSLFNGKALERTNRLYEDKKINKVIGTDAVFHDHDFAQKHPWYVEVSVARYFAKVILNINKGASISRLLK
nr:ribose-phosphate diphosphokinase [Nanoarchaeota archaeon]